MSDSNTVTKFKWIWAWQDNAEEKWLRQMSLSGLHLYSVDFAGVYTFTKGPPHDYVYRLDYRQNTRENDAEYLQLFEDAGWERISNFASWHYFRKEPMPGEEAEIFTDVDSRVAKYKRVLTVLLVVAPTTVLLLLIAAWERDIPGMGRHGTMQAS